MTPAKLILSLVAFTFFEGCARSPMPQRPVEFAFQHPAAADTKRVFLTLQVRSEQDYQSLSRRDRYLWDVCWFETEVTNGGLDQYFFNSAGDHTFECLEALEAIGAERTQAFLNNAIDLFPNRKPDADRETRQAQLLQIRGNENIDEFVSGEIDLDLYRLMMEHYTKSGTRDN